MRRVPASPPRIVQVETVLCPPCPAARAARAARVAPGPRLPDAPLELLPAPRVTHAFQWRRSSAPRGLPGRGRRAEQIHGLPDGLMVAIALSESGLHAHALNHRRPRLFPRGPATARVLAAAPGGSSVMAGCVQVNARIHARNADWPLDAERAADWAGGLLRRWHTETGSWDRRAGRWHGGSPASTRRVVCRVRAKLEVTAPGSPLLQDQSCPEGETQEARRNGAALLEVAELQDR